MCGEMKNCRRLQTAQSGLACVLAKAQLGPGESRTCLSEIPPRSNDGFGWVYFLPPLNSDCRVPPNPLASPTMKPQSELPKASLAIETE